MLNLELAIELRNKIIYTLLIILAFGCKKPENRLCYKSTGDSIEKSIELEKYSTIIMRDNIDIKLTQATNYNATITCGENLINHLKINVLNDTLYLSNENKCNNLRSKKTPITINLNVQNLKKIRCEGYGNVSSANTLLNDTLRIEAHLGDGIATIDFKGDHIATIFHSGPNDAIISGETNSSFSYHVGVGSIDTRNLKCNNASVVSRTSSTIAVSPKDNLYVEIIGSGDVYYNADLNPKIELKTKGSGKLIAE